MHDKAATPYLLDEKVARGAAGAGHGKGRAAAAGGAAGVWQESYWMVFSNKGNIVKAGHRVSVVIGQFRVDGLVVQK